MIRGHDSRTYHHLTVDR